MQSPYEKNRYFSRTACSYAACISSRPANAATSSSKLDCGKWKFVSKAPVPRNRKPG